MRIPVKFFKTTTAPAEPAEPNALYFVQNGDYADQYLTDDDGMIIKVRLGTAEYLHTQTVAATQWTINHNLGFKPDVALYDTGGNVVEAQILHHSNDQIYIYFNAAVAGAARCL
jgi:hypothetical protein